MTRLCLPHLRDGGHIVNMGSVAGRQAYENGAHYVTSKFAVRGFTYALREDLLGRPVRIHDRRRRPRRDGVLVVRFKGDRNKADAVYRGRRSAHCRGHLGLRHVGRHATVARERRRDRREGARTRPRGRILREE
jgi:NADP-dependent 3-hydroxy acid dehydrogenase YdfG